MINLLPEEVIKFNRADYHNRLLTVGLWFLAMIISSVLIIDGLRLVTINIEQQSFANLAARPQAKAPVAALTQLSKLNKQVSLVAKLDQPNSHLGHLDQSLEALLQLKPAGIKFNQILYHYESKRRTLTINGWATDRQVLVDFIDTLKSWPEATGVEAPLGNLVKDKNPAFTITLNLKP